MTSPHDNSSVFPTHQPESSPSATTYHPPETEQGIRNSLWESDLYVPGFLTLLATTPAVIVYIVVIIGARKVLANNFLPFSTALIELLHGGLVGIPAAFQLLGVTTGRCDSGVMFYNQAPSYFLNTYLFYLRLLLAAALSVEKLLRQYLVFSADIVLTRRRKVVLALVTALMVFLLRTLPDIVKLEISDGTSGFTTSNADMTGFTTGDVTTGEVTAPSNALVCSMYFRDGVKDWKKEDCRIPFTCMVVESVTHTDTQRFDIFTTIFLTVSSWVVIVGTELIAICLVIRQQSSVRAMIKHQPAQIETRRRRMVSRAKYLVINLLVITVSCLPYSIVSLIRYANMWEKHKHETSEQLILFTAVSTFLSILPGPWINLLRVAKIRYALRRSLNTSFHSAGRNTQ
eukprot:sb/3465357/